MTENQRLKVIRETLDISQTDFAASLEMSQASLSAVESGRVGVSNRLRKIVSEKYHVSLEWLFSGSGKMFVVAPKQYKNDKDHLIATLEDHIAILKTMIADKDRIIKLLTDKSRTNRTKK